MDIHEKYQFSQSGNNIRIVPATYHKNRLVLYAILAAALVCVLLYFYTQSNFGDMFVLAALSLGVLTLYVAFDIAFKVNVSFTFDRNTRAVYRKNAITNKRIMAFNELTIIHLREHGTTSFAIGINKKEFIKNYAISEAFNDNANGKKHMEEYTNKILNPILAFIKN